MNSQHLRPRVCHRRILARIVGRVWISPWLGSFQPWKAAADVARSIYKCVAGKPGPAARTHGRCDRARLLGALLVLLAAGWFAPDALAATGTCGAATGQGADGPSDYSTYCWIDFTNFNGTTASSPGGQAFTITLTGGSTLSFTLTVSTVTNAGGTTVAGGGL